MSEVRRRFLIVGMQRSGTTATLARLARHPGIALPAVEAHTSLFAAAILDRSARGESRGERTASLLSLFDHLTGHAGDAPVRGLKTALPSVAHAARLVGCLATHGPGIDLIVVRRRDLVAQFGSLRRAQHLGQWHRDAGGPPPDRSWRLRLDPDEFAAYVRQCIDCHRLLDRLGGDRNVLELDHDRHVATGADFALACAFLGLEPGPEPAAVLAKVSPPAADYIEDHAAWRARLPELVAAAERHAPPAPVFDPADSRLFLLHRAQQHRRAGSLAAALDDALAALAAPPDWGVETHEWAAATIAEMLQRLGDPPRRAAVAAQLAAGWPGDPWLQPLASRLAGE